MVNGGGDIKILLERHRPQVVDADIGGGGDMGAVGGENAEHTHGKISNGGENAAVGDPSRIAHPFQRMEGKSAAFSGPIHRDQAGG